MESCHNSLLQTILDEMTDQCFLQSRNGHHLLLSSVRCHLQQVNLQDRKSELQGFPKEKREKKLHSTTLPVFKLHWGVKSFLSGICHWLGCGSVFYSRELECEIWVFLGSTGGHCHLLSSLPEVVVCGYQFCRRDRFLFLLLLLYLFIYLSNYFHFLDFPTGRWNFTCLSSGMILSLAFLQS